MPRISCPFGSNLTCSCSGTRNSLVKGFDRSSSGFLLGSQLRPKPLGGRAERLLWRRSFMAAQAEPTGRSAAGQWRLPIHCQLTPAARSLSSLHFFIGLANLEHFRGGLRLCHAPLTLS